MPKWEKVVFSPLVVKKSLFFLKSAKLFFLIQDSASPHYITIQTTFKICGNLFCSGGAVKALSVKCYVGDRRFQQGLALLLSGWVTASVILVWPWHSCFNHM